MWSRSNSATLRRILICSKFEDVESLEWGNITTGFNILKDFNLRDA